MWYVMNEWKNEWHLVCTSNNSFCLLFMYSLSWQPSYGFRFQFNFFLLILCSFLDVIFCYEKTIFIILKTFIINITFDNSWFHLLRVYAFICKYVFISFKILCYAFCIYSYEIPFICVFSTLKGNTFHLKPFHWIRYCFVISAIIYKERLCVNLKDYIRFNSYLFFMCTYLKILGGLNLKFN